MLIGILIVSGLCAYLSAAIAFLFGASFLWCLGTVSVIGTISFLVVACCSKRSETATGAPHFT
jgi:hypothetical protein